MKNFQVQARGIYVNEKKGLIREVTEVDGEGRAHWRSYVLSDGRPTGDFLVCWVGTIIQWADRAATPEEAARLKRSEVRTLESYESDGMGKRHLATDP